MKKKVILMISNGEKCEATSEERLWHYLAGKKLSALLREIASKNNCDICCLNCLHSFRTKNKLESHKGVGENKNFCIVIMLSENTKIIEFWYQKSDKAPFMIYADLECIIEA